MGAEIKRVIPEVEITLIPGGRGDLIVTRGDEVIWDKKGMGNVFPDASDIIPRLQD